jgi:hypothetical protein
MSKAGGDVYGEQRGLSGLFVALVANPYFWITLLVGASAITLEVIKVGRTPRTEIAPGQLAWIAALRRYPLTVFAALTLIQIVGESFFYQNSLSQGVFSPARYGIGSELAAVSIAMIATALAISFYEKRSAPNKLTLRVAASALSVGVVLGSLAPIGRAATEFPALSQGTISYLSYQMSVMEEAASYLIQFEDAQVLLLLDEPYDFERAMSLPLFLENLADRETLFFVQAQIPKELEVDPLQEGLASRLKDISTDGSMDRPWQISPIDQINSESEVLCFFFGQEVSLPSCTRTIGIG